MVRPDAVPGRDACHIEGAFVFTDDDDPARNPGRMSMRYGLANLPPADIRKTVSDNAIAMLGLDPAWAAGIAARIGSPSLKELKTPIQAIPENGGILSFRTVGPWY